MNVASQAAPSISRNVPAIRAAASPDGSSRISM
jgi:hypothetical protein